MDAGLALVGVGAIVASIVELNVDPPSETDHGNKSEGFALVMTAGLVLAVVEGAQALYGTGVADRCYAARAKSGTKLQ